MFLVKPGNSLLWAQITAIRPECYKTPDAKFCGFVFTSTGRKLTIHLLRTVAPAHKKCMSFSSQLGKPKICVPNRKNYLRIPVNSYLKRERLSQRGLGNHIGRLTRKTPLSQYLSYLWLVSCAFWMRTLFFLSWDYGKYTEQFTLDTWRLD